MRGRDKNREQKKKKNQSDRDLRKSNKKNQEGKKKVWGRQQKKLPREKKSAKM